MTPLLLIGLTVLLLTAFVAVSEHLKSTKPLKQAKRDLERQKNKESN